MQGAWAVPRHHRQAHHAERARGHAIAAHAALRTGRPQRFKALRDLLSRLRPADGGAVETEGAATEATTEEVPAEPQDPSAVPPDTDDAVAEHLSPVLLAANDTPPDDPAPDAGP